MAKHVSAYATLSSSAVLPQGCLFDAVINISCDSKSCYVPSHCAVSPRLFACINFWGLQGIPCPAADAVYVYVTTL